MEYSEASQVVEHFQAEWLSGRITRATPEEEEAIRVINAHHLHDRYEAIHARIAEEERIYNSPAMVEARRVEAEAYREYKRCEQEAAARRAYQRWLNKRVEFTERDRYLVSEEATRRTNVDIAREWGISSGRVSQLRVKAEVKAEDEWKRAAAKLKLWSETGDWGL